MTKYIIDSANGIIFDSTKQNSIDKYNLDFIRNGKIEFAKYCYDNGIKRIDTFQINASAYACAASCVYCANDSCCMTREEATNDFMTPEYLRQKLRYIKSKVPFANDLEISFSGGDFILHPSYEKLIDVVFEEIEGNISFGWCMSGFHQKEDIDKFLSICDSLEANPRVIRNSIYLTCDMDGGNFRASPIYNMTNDDAFDVAYRLAKHFNGKKTILAISSKISSECNVDVMKKNFDSFFNNYSDVIIRIGLIDGYYHVTPTVEHVRDTFAMVNDNYLTYYQSRGASTLMVVSKDREDIKKQFGGYSMYLYELEDGVYANHPMDLYCWCYIRFLGMDNKGYFPCFFGFDHTDDLDDILKPNVYSNPGLSSEFERWTNGECVGCEFYALCKMCKRISCKNRPFRKEYMRQLINVMSKDPSTWCITNNPFKSGYLK